jgi:hypothetical protein
MPANINIDPSISLGIKQQDSMTSLSNLLNAANAAQQFKQAQQINPLQVQQQKQLTEQGAYATDRAAQENKERINTQIFLSDPENWQTDGRIDINKINLQLPQIAPLTGDATISRLTTLGDAQTKGIKAKLNLDTEQRAIIAGPLDILGRLGVEDKSKYIEELNRLKQKNPKNKDLHDLIDSQKVMIENVPKGTSLASLAIRGSQELLSPESKETAFRQTAGTADTGAGVIQTTTTPSIGGVPPKIEAGVELLKKQLPPGSRIVMSGNVDQNNLPTAFVYSADGTSVQELSLPIVAPQPNQQQNAPQPVQQQNVQQVNPNAPVVTQAAPNQMVEPANRPPVRLPPGETAETKTAAQQIIANASEAAKTVQLQQFNNNQIIKLADKVATGAGAEVLANLSGGYAGLPFTSDNADNLNKLGHYMALQTAALTKSAGVANTNAGQDLSSEMSGKLSWTPEAIKSTARVNRALSSGADMFNRGIQNSYAKTKSPFSAREFQNRWSQVADVNAIRLIDAAKNKESDPDGFNEFLTSVGAVKNGKPDPSSPVIQKLRDKANFLINLSKGK